MKFTKLMTVTGLALLLAVTGVGATQVSAATNDTATTTAEFSITDGELKLQDVPDLNFGTKSVEDIMKTPIISLVDNTTKDNDQTSNTDIKVSNYKVAANGWTLTAQASKFNNGTADLDGVKLTVKPQTATTTISDTDTTSSDTTATSSEAKNIVGASATVLSGDPALGVTTANVNNSADATLDLSGVTDRAKLVAGDYTSTVTWTLAEGAPTTPAK